MRSSPIAACVLGALLAAEPSAGAVAAERTRAGEARSDARSDQAVARPEHRQRRLPDDVFKPSEEVGEDHPVPFPVDI